MSTPTVPVRGRNDMPQPPRAGCPFVGLVPFDEADEAFFFGRGREAATIADNLLAFRLTILYGPSGVGKSSVLRAAVLPHLRRRAVRHVEPGEPPEFHVVMFSAWRDDPVVGLRRQLEETIGSRARPDSVTLHDVLRDLADAVGGVILVALDQVDEYFLYHPDQDDPFNDQLAEVVNDAALPVNVLIAIREDSLAKLDRFKGRIPRLFSNYLRIQHLNVDTAREAIVGPIAVHNETALHDDRMSVEPALVEAVLEEVRTARTGGAALGAGTVDDATLNWQVEAPHLQIVMTRLWVQERSEHSSTLRAETLEALGGADAIIRAHLDEAMAAFDPADQDLAASSFRHLVTPSGAKIALSAADLASYTDQTEPRLASLLDRLAASESRILRSVPPSPDRPAERRFEIFHDILGPAVLDWRLRHDQAREREAAEAALLEERESARQRLRAAHRRAVWMGAVALVMTILLVLGSLVFWSYTRERDANESRRLAAQATAQLGVEPRAALATALRAMEADSTDEAERALRLAMSTSPHSEILDTADYWREMRVSGDGGTFLASGGTASLVPAESVSTDRAAEESTTMSASDAAGDDDVVRVWHAEGDGVTEQPLLRPGGAIFTTALNRSGDLVAIAQTSGVTTWSSETGERVARIPVADASALAFSPDRDALAVGTQTGRVGLWNGRTGEIIQPQRRVHSGWVNAVGIAEAGSTTVMSGSADGDAVVWDLSGSRRRFSSYADVTTALLTADARRLVTVDDYGDSYLWYARGGRQVPLETVGFFAMSGLAALSPDQSQVAVTRDKRISVYSTADGSFLSWLTGHRDHIYSVAFDGHGRLLSASGDGTARIWDIASGQTITVLPAQAEMYDAFFLPGGNDVVTRGDDGIRLWQLPKIDELTKAQGLDAWYLDADFTPDGSKVAAVNRLGQLRVWTTGSKEDVRTYRACDPEDALGLCDMDESDPALESLKSFVKTAYDVAVSPDGRRVATAWMGPDEWSDNGVTQWNVRTDKRVHVPEPDAGWYGPPFIAYASASGDMLISDRAQLYVWDGKGAPQPVLTEALTLPDVLQGATIASDGQTIVMARRNAVVGLDAETGKAHWTRTNLDGRVMALDRGDDRLAVIDYDWSVDVLDLTTGRSIAEITRREQGSQPTSVALSPDGRSLVVGANDGMESLWRLPDDGSDAAPELLTRTRYHGDYVNSVQFSPDGGHVVSTGDDGRVLMWGCDLCVGADELMDLARQRLRAGEQPGDPS